jgi:hypothetical protein
MGLIVDHPAHGDGDALKGERGKDAGSREIEIAGMAQNAILVKC